MSARGSIIIRYITTMVIVGLAVPTAAISYNTWKEIGRSRLPMRGLQPTSNSIPNLTVGLRAPGMTGGATNG